MSQQLLTLSARVGYRYRVTFSLPLTEIRPGAVLATEATWTPIVPKRLSPNAHDALTAEVLRLLRTGGRAAVLETGTGLARQVEPARRPQS